jgi:hypothetical protein
MAGGFSLKKLFGKGAAGWSGPKTVEPGMRFRQTRQLGSIWKVTRKVESFGQSLPHVMIIREGYEDETRVISVSALRDTRFYQFIPPEEGAEENPPQTNEAGSSETAGKDQTL